MAMTLGEFKRTVAALKGSDEIPVFVTFGLHEDLEIDSISEYDLETDPCILVEVSETP